MDFCQAVQVAIDEAPNRATRLVLEVAQRLGGCGDGDEPILQPRSGGHGDPPPKKD